MLITEILARNSRMYGSETALVEREPAKNRRKEITWKEFDDQANQVARALIARGITKGDRVVHLMTNCIEWLPVYFGILRTGAWAVPLNFRFVAKTIQRCAETAEAKALIFGQEFIERIDSIKQDLDRFVETYIFLGPEKLRPDYAESYQKFLKNQSPMDTEVPALWKICITVRPTGIISFASLPYITPEPRCTGSAISLWEPGALSSKELNPSGSWKPFQKNR
jgi:acyl-CoA synthetase (AMP-forming)/AMP-acid ligase II